MAILEYNAHGNNRPNIILAFKRCSPLCQIHTDTMYLSHQIKHFYKLYFNIIYNYINIILFLTSKNTYFINIMVN
jgi:hypothetical protein